MEDFEKIKAKCAHNSADYSAIAYNHENERALFIGNLSSAPIYSTDTVFFRKSFSLLTTLLTSLPLSHRFQSCPSENT